MRTPTCIAGAVAALALLLAGPALAEIRITDGWARETVPGATVGAGYLVIRNTGNAARKLMRLTSPATSEVALHRSSIDAQGVARMWPMASLQIGAGETVTFEPHGRHLMFMDLKAPFKAGDRIPVTFEFSDGEKPVTVMLTVRPLVEDAATAGHGGHSRH